MQDILKTLTTRPKTFLGRIGTDPLQLMTVREWWFEMDEPVETLTDPQATFREDEQKLIELCTTEGVAYRKTAHSEAAFPAWLLGKFYPSNP
jgi:hypothetical protein